MGGRSSGLEAANVDLWLYGKFAVFFVPRDKTEVKGGQQSTNITDDLRIIYMRILLQDRSVSEPTVYIGVLYDIKNKGKAKWLTKFEHCMGHFEYNDEKIFRVPTKIEYEDTYVSLKGELLPVNLYDISNSEEIRAKIVLPSLTLLRK